MGAAAAIVVPSHPQHVPGLVALVAWVPNPNTDPLAIGPDAVLEENGQLAAARYWLQARHAHGAGCLR